MKIAGRIGVVALGLLLIPLAAVLTTALKKRFSDGPGLVFAGGPLAAGVIHEGPDPDWALVADVPTIELQLLDPPRSRRIWTTHHDGKLYVWSGYMGTTVGRIWKHWPVQAERDGRAVLRIEGVRYERRLVRITEGEELDGIISAITSKYPSQTTRAAVEDGSVWLFEARPR